MPGTSASIALEFPNSYIFGVFAKDDFGNTSGITTTTWSFPESFTPPVLSSHLNSASQDFVLDTGGKAKSIKVFTKDFTTTSKNANSNVCFLKLLEVTATTTVELATSDAPNDGGGQSSDYAYRGYGCAGNLEFTFSSLPELVASTTYRWTFGFNFHRAKSSARISGAVGADCGGKSLRIIACIYG